MNKKIIILALILPLFLTMPFIGANTSVTPEDMEYSNIAAEDGSGNECVANDGSFDFDGTTIEVTEVNASWTSVNLNQSLIIDIYQGEDYFKAFISKVISLEPELYEFVVSFEMYSYEAANTTFIVKLPAGVSIVISDKNNDDWVIQINDFTIFWNDVTRIFDVFNTDIHVHVENFEGYEYVYVNYFGYVIDFWRWDDRGFYMYFHFTYEINATYIPPAYTGTLNVDYKKEGSGTVNVFSGFPVYPDLEWYDGEAITIAFISSVLIIANEGYIISIYEDKVVLEYYLVAIVIYFTTIIERIIVMFYEYTFIIYFTVVELYFVIIWEIFEIKFYEYQIVIVYEYFEIILLLFEFHYEVNIYIHLELWIIEIKFLIMINNPIIIQPVIWRFIPIIVPIMVPLYFFIPVYINQYTYIYLPYLAEQVLIDIYDEMLQKPTHTIQYFVYDQAKNPIIDATVNVNYNGSNYAATHVGGGIYQVLLPASDESEVINVTATKAYYPTGTLVYTLEVNWTDVIDTTTVAGSLPLLPIIASLVTLALGTVLYSKKKRN